MTTARDTERVVRDCAEAGIRSVWMHRGGGQGSVRRGAVDFCHEQGMHLVEGYCPFMFLPRTPFFHRVRGSLLKLTGPYPEEARGRGSIGVTAGYEQAATIVHIRPGFAQESQAQNQ